MTKQAAKFREACIRCPMLHVDPKMAIRLVEVEDGLLVRRERAETEGWHGEIEGLDLTLSFLRAKRQEANRLEHKSSLSGFPSRSRRMAQ